MGKISTIIINILFVQSIANRFVKEGYKVLWPVMDIYAPLAKHFPNVTMVDKALVNIDYSRTDFYEFNGCRVLPLRFADSLTKVPYTLCMAAKYLLMGQEWETWKDDCEIVRDTKNEDFLYYETLGLKDGEKYNLISEQFSTGGLRKVEIQSPDNGLRNVYMNFIPTFTAIDWLKVMQNATEIFAISSSCIYLFELFPMKAERINLFIRRPQEQNHNNYSYILTKDKYILHP